MQKKILFLMIVLFSTISFADNKLKSKIRSASKEYLSSHFMNGIYMFGDDESILLQGAKGIYSLEPKKIPLKNNQITAIASATKPMTAAVILKLQEENKLNVNDTVATYLGEDSGIWQQNIIPAWAHKVTIHNLLTHRSGLAEYFMAANIDTTKQLSQITKDIANFASTKGLSFVPGEKHHYCNTNFIILGIIIEKLKGRDLATVFQNELFDPLNMKDTRLISLSEAVNYQLHPEKSKYPTRYFVTPTGKQPKFTIAKSTNLMIPFADGGVISTTEDLIKWQRALHSGKVLSEDSYKLMTNKYYEVDTNNGMKKYVGYGIFVSELPNGETIYQHSGSALAIRSEVGYMPSKRLYYAVLSNVMNFIPKDMQDKIDMNLPANQLDIRYFIDYILKAV